MPGGTGGAGGIKHGGSGGAGGIGNGGEPGTGFAGVGTGSTVNAQLGIATLFNGDDGPGAGLDAGVAMMRLTR